MSFWLFALFTCVVFVITAGKQESKMRFSLPDFFLNARQDDLCRSMFFEYCPKDDESDVDDKMNYFVNLDLNEQEQSDQSKKIQPRTFQPLRVLQKRRTASFSSCCHMKNHVKDLGFYHYPRYLLSVVCENNGNASCKPVYYKVKVLTTRSPMENPEADPLGSQLPETLRSEWKLKIVSVQVGCYCS